MTITPDLESEGLARELVNRIQNLRKDMGLEVTDRILLTIEKTKETENAFHDFQDYICSETLAQIKFVENINDKPFKHVELVDGISLKLMIEKNNV
jgi:isoleucyl-tRNA synthetase